MRWRHAISAIGVVLLSCTTNLPAQGETKYGLDADAYRLWERHWRDYAQRCAIFEDEYLCCPNYNKRYPSSAGMTLREARQALSQKVKVRSGNMVSTKTIHMPVEEAEAMIKPIPRLTPGQYGYLSSAKVDEVLDATSVVIEDVQLIDSKALALDYKADRANAKQADDSKEAIDILDHHYARRMDLADRQKHKSFKQAMIRLEGVSTRGLAEGQRWDGPRKDGLHILIVRSEYYASGRRPRKRLVAVAVDQVRWGLDEMGFVAMLKQRGLDPAGFVALVMAQMKELDPETAKLAVFDALLPPEPEKPDKDRRKDEDETTEDDD